jgi:hypothetical protein
LYERIETGKFCPTAKIRKPNFLFVLDKILLLLRFLIATFFSINYKINIIW